MSQRRAEMTLLRPGERKPIPAHHRSTWAAPPQFFHRNSYNIFMDLLILLLTFCEISLVLYLSIHHFLDAANKDVEAMAMLLPIALNFIGVLYFLSNPEERAQFESIGCTRCCTDILQFPVIGPVLTAFAIFLISCGWAHSMENYQRLEASAAKCRQMTSFFSAAPEAVVQLTVLLVSEADHLNLSKYFEIIVVIVAVFSLAEANTFSLITNYFRIFHKYDSRDWHVPHKAKFWEKLLLFLHAFTSIGSRIVATALVKAAIFYYSGANMFAIVLVISLLAEMTYKALLYYLARLLKYLCLRVEVPSGCYESLNYAWRETILSFGFQSRNICVQAWFYIENIGFFIFWVFAVEGPVRFTPELQWVRQMPFVPISIIFCVLIGLSFLLLLINHCTKLFVLRGPFYEDRGDGIIQQT